LLSIPVHIAWLPPFINTKAAAGKAAAGNAAAFAQESKASQLLRGMHIYIADIRY
jgi:hypothetical protein